MISDKLSAFTKLFLLILANFFFIFPFELLNEMIFVILLTLLLSFSNHIKIAVRFLFFYSLMLVIHELALEYYTTFVGATIAGVSLGFTLIVPCMMAGTLLIKTTSISDLINVLVKLHVPKFLIIPFIVMLRFIPHFFEDIKSIHSAMILRLATQKKGTAAILNRIEYFLIPLLNSAINAANQLSIAGLSKGIDYIKTRTVLTPFKLGLEDIVILIISSSIILS